ncbi:MAG: 16S rRNA (uracil(1498)-N(3))-methyltransferase [Bacteroidales bacterium]|jgi:16S rRNA (uracil1498-N3)-methyltransferase|nr:16S rRNA (uracil(1498)-N(3))-methyltransferase [Bacteroidales bacterium]
MQLFYTTDITGTVALFSREESGHCLRVMRMRKGDNLVFTDGKGNMYEGIIADDDPSAMTVNITGVREEAGKRHYNLHMAISPLKNEDRLEWFVEKAVEIGVDEITPLICSRTEKKRIRKERLESIILSAMKQSVKAYLPVLNGPVTFSEMAKRELICRKLIATCETDVQREAIINAVVPAEDILILTGPEGDFTPEEVSLALKEGFVAVHLGPSRLRTETAGVAACCSVYLANI